MEAMSRSSSPSGYQHVVIQLMECVRFLVHAVLSAYRFLVHVVLSGHSLQCIQFECIPTRKAQQQNGGMCNSEMVKCGRSTYLELICTAPLVEFAFALSYLFFLVRCLRFLRTTAAPPLAAEPATAAAGMSSPFSRPSVPSRTAASSPRS